LFDALLELEHHRAGGIDDLDVVTAGEFVGLWGFAVGTEEHLHVVELTHVVVVDGDEAHILQAFALHTVVDNIAKAIELGGWRLQIPSNVLGSEFFFGLADGGGHTETEATARVNFDFH
jgi:hypothetical protein